jgi:hypothetical protein
MPDYNAAFPHGTAVRVADLPDLEAFQDGWKLHNPLAQEQLSFAGYAATVSDASFYHGGDVLYELAEVPGIWHESCLRPSA